MGIILTGDISEATRGNSHDASFWGHKRRYERKYLGRLFSNTGNRQGVHGKILGKTGIPMSRCWGITKELRFCRREAGEKLFCRRHKAQPKYFLAVALTAILFSYIAGLIPVPLKGTLLKVSHDDTFAMCMSGSILQNMLSSLDTGLSHRWVEEFLGVPTSESDHGSYHFATYVNSLCRLSLVYCDDTIAAYVITSRDPSFRPEIAIEEGFISTLCQTTFQEFLPKRMSVDEWDCPLLAKDVLYWETTYLGNAKNYETCLLAYSWSIGANVAFNDDAASWLSGTMEMIVDREINLTPEQRQDYWKKLRNTSAPNIIAFSSLHVHGEIPEGFDFDLNKALIYAGTKVSDSAIKLIGNR